MSDIRLGGLNMIPPVVKNLIIINVLFYIATLGLAEIYSFDLTNYLGLHYFTSPEFQPYQIITSMFMHSVVDFKHILFNMFTLWMFGSTLESYWGPKKFLTYYMVAGIGAGAIHLLVMHIRILSISNEIPTEVVDIVIHEGMQSINILDNMIKQQTGLYQLLSPELFPKVLELFSSVNSISYGASGSTFGLLLAFGMIFPNAGLALIFLPIPIKAKYFVLIFGAYELYSGISNNPTDNVAHFAHLGGMLFGFILIKIWQNQQKNKHRIY